jgi:phosphatidylglycerophosphate synthase
MLGGITTPVRGEGERGGFLSQVERMRRLHTRERALLWSYAVNYRIGAAVAVALLRTRVSANTVTVAALAVNAAGAAVVLLVDAPASGFAVVAVLVVWQLAYSLDCADGLLARARGQASPFGAWLDQVADFIGHTMTFGTLAVFVARALSLSGAAAAAVAAVAVAGSVVQLFAASQRNSLLGTAPAVTGAQPRWLHLASFGQQLADYGLYLVVCSLLLAAPWALLAVIVGFALLSLLAVVAQVALNWVAHARRATGG